MCGITGAILTDPSIIEPRDFEVFNRSLSHRGPDAENTFQFQNIFLGHTRLAIIDTDNRSNQPFTENLESSRTTITFNGEIYNYDELREQLILKGHKFRTRSDTEVVLKSFIEWGEACQEKFNGMWAFAIHFSSTNEVFISRDRFGVKPLYLYTPETSSGIFFASEIKSFWLLPKKLIPNIDNKLMNFLSQRPNNNTELITPICCLPAGHSLKISGSGKTKLAKWWDMKPERAREDNYKNNLEVFQNLLLDSLKIRLKSDAPVCSALSGGMDSSSIVSILGTDGLLPTPNNYKAFIFEYDTNEMSESEYALSLTRQKDINFTHIKHSTESKIFTSDLIEDCIESSEQLNSLHLGPYLIYKAMREQGYKVSIDGHGADEILGGYIQFATPTLADALGRSDEKEFQETYETWSKLGYNLVSIDKCRKIISQKYSIDSSDFSEPSFFDQKRLSEIKSGTLPWILNTYDKLPMRHGIEVRSPFLDWRLVKFCLELPTHYFIRDGYTKNILRDALQHCIPNQIRRRKTKLGFLPQTNFFLRIPAIQSIIKDTIRSEFFLSSNFFDGKTAARQTEKALLSRDYKQLMTLWRFTQSSIFLNKLNSK